MPKGKVSCTLDDGDGYTYWLQQSPQALPRQVYPLLPPHVASLETLCRSASDVCGARRSNETNDEVRMAADGTKQSA
jgi:hypothetical protein